MAGATEGPFRAGLFVVKPGSKKAVKVPGTVKARSGSPRLGKIFVSSGRKIVAFARFDGKRFRARKGDLRRTEELHRLQRTGVGPERTRLYASVSASAEARPPPTPRCGNSVVSVGLAGKNVKVVTTGLRQPWMMTFAPGSGTLRLGLGPDTPVNNGAPDLIVKARPVPTSASRSATG